MADLEVAFMVVLKTIAASIPVIVILLWFWGEGNTNPILMLFLYGISGLVSSTLFVYFILQAAEENR